MQRTSKLRAAIARGGFVAVALGALAAGCTVERAAVVVTPAGVVTAGPQSCSARLYVTGMDVSSRTCQIDARVAGQPGVLTYPCAGGAAEAMFGAARFSGTVMNGMVDLQTSTTFPFSDGCTWQSAQRISGAIATRQLRYEYGEAPLPDQQRRCAPACQAAGAVGVQ